MCVFSCFSGIGVERRVADTASAVIAGHDDAVRFKQLEYRG